MGRSVADMTEVDLDMCANRPENRFLKTDYA